MLVPQEYFGPESDVLLLYQEFEVLVMMMADPHSRSMGLVLTMTKGGGNLLGLQRIRLLQVHDPG